jgi:hypothetical protein
MDEPAQIPAGRPLWRTPAAWLAALALACYAAMLAANVGAYATGSDSSGYLNHARLLSEGTLHMAPREVPGLRPPPGRDYVYIPLGFKPGTDGRTMVPTYASGFPLLIVAAERLVGWDRAADVVICVHALIGLLLTYGLGRAMGLPRRWSVVATALIAASPLYLNYSLHAMSDMPATVWTTAAILLAWHARRRPALAAASGAAVAVSVLIRPSDALVFIPVALALGLSPRRWLLLGLGGLPGAIFFCAHSLAAYGSLFATGYGDVSSVFGARWVAVTLRHYARWLPILFTPAIVAALGLPWLARVAPRQAAVLGSWALCLLAFYSAYYCTNETWWYLRFVLPAAPALAVGGLMVIRRLAEGAAGRWPDAAARLRDRLHPTQAFVLALVLIAANGARWTQKLNALHIGRDERVYPEAAAWLRGHAPPDAVVVAMQMSGALIYYTDFVVIRWDQYDPASARKAVAALEAAHRPIYAALFPFEKDDALRASMPGNWTQVAFVDPITIWRRDPPPPGRTAPVVTPLPPSGDGSARPAFARTLSIGPAPPVARALMAANAAAWLLLAWMLWRILDARDARGRIALCGVLLSAGAVSSVRLGLADVVVLAAISGSVAWWEGKGGTRLSAWIAAGVVFAAWHFGSFDNEATFLGHWPVNAFLAKVWAVVGGVGAHPGSGAAWADLCVTAGLAAQALYVLTRTPSWKSPWWLLGAGGAAVLLLVGAGAWRGYAGEAVRIVLPMTLAFNVLARRQRAALAWLIAGNLGIAGGVFAAFDTPLPPDTRAALLADGKARLAAAGAGWYPDESDAQHIWMWSSVADARVAIATKPGRTRPLGLKADLRSLEPRTVAIRQDGRVLWRGEVGRAGVPISLGVEAGNGSAVLDFSTDLPPARSGAKGDGRLLAFALYDVRVSDEGANPAAPAAP